MGQSLAVCLHHCHAMIVLLGGRRAADATDDSEASFTPLGI